MTVNAVGKVVGGGMPAGKAGASRNEVGEVKTRKATPEELAGLDAAIRRKYGEKELERDKRKARAAMGFKELGEKRKQEEQPLLDDETIGRLYSCCRHVTRDEWERMRAFVAVAGAIRRWE